MSSRIDETVVEPDVVYGLSYVDFTGLNIAPPVMVGMDDTVEVAVHHMRARGIGSVMVTDDRESLVGVLTEFDLLRNVGCESPDLSVVAIKDVMTPDPACCTPTTSLDEVAKLMAQNDCGEIPVVDPADQIIGVVTDRDIVCRIVAAGKNPMAYTAETCMSGPVVTVPADAPLEALIAALKHLGITKVSVASRWTDTVNDSIKRYLADAGIEVVHTTKRNQWASEAFGMTIEEGLKTALEVGREAAANAPAAEGVFVAGGAATAGFTCIRSRTCVTQKIRRVTRSMRCFACSLGTVPVGNAAGSYFRALSEVTWSRYGLKGNVSQDFPDAHGCDAGVRRFVFSSTCVASGRW